MQPTMYLDYPYSEITDPMKEDPYDPPSSPLQLLDVPSPESFDQECDNDEEVAKYSCSPERMDHFFPGDYNLAISTQVSTLSAFTNSTDSSYEIGASSQYSFNATSSNYANHSELETHGSMNSSLCMQTFEFADPLLYDIPPLNPAEAHGTMDLKSNSFADDYFTAMQQLGSLTCVDPAALSVQQVSDSEAQTAPVPVKKPFKCPLCPFASARKHNLKTHIETHNEASKRFACSVCDRPFTRKHDLRRHRETIHGERLSSLSATSVSSRRFGPNPDLPQYRTTTASGDERPTSSHHLGSSSTTGLEDSVACWNI